MDPVVFGMLHPMERWRTTKAPLRTPLLPFTIPHILPVQKDPERY